MTPTTRHSKWRIALRSLGAVAATVVVALIVWGVIWYRRAHAPAPLVLSKETTFITWPVQPDGSINYVAALNKRYGNGVTRDNNGAVLFWRAMGPSDIEPEDRDEFFKQLGMPPLSEKGDYFVSLAKFVKRIGDAAKVSDEIDLSPTPPEYLWTERLEIAMTRPWSRDEFPILAQWLEANEGPLALLEEASRRPRWFNPFVPETEMVISVKLPATRRWREVAQTLVARAMFRTQAGQLEEAWEDLMTCHRLARLCGQGPTLIDGLVEFAFAGLACDGDQALLQHASLTTRQINRMRSDFGKLASLVKMDEKLDVAERMTMLDIALTVQRSETGALKKFMGVDQSDGSIVFDIVRVATIDWNVVLHICNTWYDRVVAARRSPLRSQQRAEMQRMSDELHELGRNANRTPSLLRSMLTDPQRAASERVGEILVTWLMPALNAVFDAEAKGEIRFELVKLGLALAAYHAEHESYPETLAELMPNYVAEIPIDVFSGAELHYERHEEGYLLYSVGMNGQDDGGSGDGSQNHDDLVIRVSGAEKQ